MDSMKQFCFDEFSFSKTTIKRKSRYSGKAQQIVHRFRLFTIIWYSCSNIIFFDQKHRYFFGLNLSGSQVFQPFQMDLWWKTQNRKCLPRSGFQNPDYQKNHSTLFTINKTNYSKCICFWPDFMALYRCSFGLLLIQILCPKMVLKWSMKTEICSQRQMYRIFKVYLPN